MSFVCSNLSKSYGKKQALDQLSVEFTPGHIIGLLGPNGSGKSTLIKLASGLLVPTSGQILIDGMPPSEQTKQLVSYLPERTYLPSNMKVSEAIDFFVDFYTNFDRKKANDMLADLQIDSTAKFSSMSKGTREKVQLILVMSRNARLYLLDEPIGGVDPAARDYILNTIIRGYNQDATLVISTHLIEDIETVLDDVVIIGNGKLVLQSSVETIREQNNKSVDALFREVFKC